MSSFFFSVFCRLLQNVVFGRSCDIVYTGGTVSFLVLFGQVTKVSNLFFCLAFILEITGPGSCPSTLRNRLQHIYNFGAFQNIHLLLHCLYVFLAQMLVLSNDYSILGEGLHWRECSVRPKWRDNGQRLCQCAKAAHVGLQWCSCHIFSGCVSSFWTIWLTWLRLHL